MIRKLAWIAAVAASLAVAACAPTTRFEWGGYEQALYAYTQSPENREVYQGALETAIERGRARNAVAPGLLAELGYVHLEEGNTAEALKYFREERARFPESAGFMDRVINQIGTPETATAGGSN